MKIYIYDTLNIIYNTKYNMDIHPEFVFTKENFLQKYKNNTHFYFGYKINQNIDFLPSKIKDIYVYYPKYIYNFNSIKTFIKTFTLYDVKGTEHSLNYSFSLQHVKNQFYYSNKKYKIKIPYGCKKTHIIDING